MSNSHGIVILGANGSGKSTLGHELARVLNFAHLDAENYYWHKTDMPFTIARSYEERQEMLLFDIEKCGSFVMSGDVSDWGEQFLPLFDLVVFLTVPTDIRIEQIERREFKRFGDRIHKGGDMYEQHLEFVEFAAARSIALLEQLTSLYSCPILRVDGTEDYRTTAASIAERFYTKPGEPCRVTVSNLSELEKYRFTVIFAQHGRVGGKWLYCRHKYRDTWETAGGHIEVGETPLDCAKRELYEETGATKFYIHPAFDYSVHTATEFSYGQVFFADIEALGDIPKGSEMMEVQPFDTIPDKMTYPSILPVLYEKMQSWLGLDKAKTEYWDVLDADRKHTGRTHKRGDTLPDGDYHLVVRAWIVNSKGEFLITRRAFNKIGFPGMWEIPSGSATAGEDSLTATIREAKEESGITLFPEKLNYFQHTGVATRSTITGYFEKNLTLLTWCCRRAKP